jgi:Zn finger protein HypA/HybF involved in hydrogenase expression
MEEAKTINSLDPVVEIQVVRTPVEFGFDPDIECGKCGCDLYTTQHQAQYKYCPNCGGKLKW